MREAARQRWYRAACSSRQDFVERRRRRFEPGDAYFSAPSARWSEGVRTVFKELPELQW